MQRLSASIEALDCDVLAEVNIRSPYKRSFHACDWCPEIACARRLLNSWSGHSAIQRQSLNDVRLRLDCRGLSGSWIALRRSGFERGCDVGTEHFPGRASGVGDGIAIDSARCRLRAARSQFRPDPRADRCAGLELPRLNPWLSRAASGRTRSCGQLASSSDET